MSVCVPTMYVTVMNTNHSMQTYLENTLIGASLYIILVGMY